MILPVFFIFLCARFAESHMGLYEGNACNLTSGSRGICTRLSNCEPVKQELILGKTVTNICGYIRFEQIVCCPRFSTMTRMSRPDIMPADGRGAISRQKCAQYSRYAYSDCSINGTYFIEKTAQPKEYPHMVAVGYEVDETYIGWYCSGTLISETFVLTAAHCANSTEWGSANWVRVGDINLEREDDEATPIDLRIVEVIEHPQYEFPSQYHDIALLRLESPVTFNAWIRPACLQTTPSADTGNVIATGWGRVQWLNNDDGYHLVATRFSLIDTETCDANFMAVETNVQRSIGVVGNWIVCAGSESPGICQGGSGGPLVIPSNREYRCMYDVVGVTSSPKSCGSEMPGIYTRVYHYISWIESIVWPTPGRYSRKKYRTGNQDGVTIARRSG